jgi:hypothetical protein
MSQSSIFKSDNIRKLAVYFDNIDDDKVKDLSAEMLSLYKENVRKLNLFLEEMATENMEKVSKCIRKFEETNDNMKLAHLNDIVCIDNDETSEERMLIEEVLKTVTAKNSQEDQQASEWKVGSIIEAKDLAHTKSGYEWYKSKIVEIKDNRCKVHYHGWHNRFDTWYNLNSSSLRNYSETREMERELERRAKFRVGDKCLAKSSPDENKFYPGKISQLKLDNQIIYYEVLFYEMEFLKYLVKYDNVKELDSKNNQNRSKVKRITCPSHLIADDDDDQESNESMDESK